MSAAVNGPFVVQTVGGAERYGLRGQEVSAQLAVVVLGSDQRPPTDAQGQPVPVRVTWEVLQVPDGADARLLSGSRSQLDVTTNGAGQARIGMRLGRQRGRYLVRAAVREDGAGVDAFFDVYTEGVVSSIVILPIQPTVVGEAMRIRVRASDWRGRPVNGAALYAGLEGFDYPPPPESTSVRERALGSNLGICY